MDISGEDLFFDHCAIFIVCMSIENRKLFGCLLLDHAVKGLDNHLTEPFACPHDIGRIYCFVRTDQNESLTAVHHCRISSLVSTDDIVFDRFTWTVFHERHMLVRCRMVDHVRPVGFKYCIDSSGIPNRTDQYNQIKLRIVFL